MKSILRRSAPTVSVLSLHPRTRPRGCGLPMARASPGTSGARALGQFGGVQPRQHAYCHRVTGQDDAGVGCRWQTRARGRHRVDSLGVGPDVSHGVPRQTRRGSAGVQPRWQRASSLRHGRQSRWGADGTGEPVLRSRVPRRRAPDGRSTASGPTNYRGTRPSVAPPRSAASADGCSSARPEKPGPRAHQESLPAPRVEQRGPLRLTAPSPRAGSRPHRPAHERGQGRTASARGHVHRQTVQPLHPARSLHTAGRSSSSGAAKPPRTNAQTVASTPIRPASQPAASVPAGRSASR